MMGSMAMKRTLAILLLVSSILYGFSNFVKNTYLSYDLNSGGNNLMAQVFSKSETSPAPNKEVNNSFDAKYLSDLMDKLSSLREKLVETERERDFLKKNRSFIVSNDTGEEPLLNFSAPYRSNLIGTIQPDRSNSTDSFFEAHFRKVKAANNDAHPRVAFCMTGAIRSLPSPFVYKNIKKNIDYAVGNGTPYLIMLLKNETNSGKYSTKGISKQDLHSAIDHLKPIHWRFVDPPQYLPGDSIKNACLKYKYRGFKTGHYMQMYGWKQCYKEVERQEWELGFKFDWVVKIRPDAIYLSSIPRVQTLNPNAVTFSYIWGSAVGDKIWYSPRRFAKVVFGAFNIYKNIPKNVWKDEKAMLDNCDLLLDPEHQLVRQMEINQVPFESCKRKVFDVLVRIRPDGVCYLDCQRKHGEQQTICEQYQESYVKAYCENTTLYK